MLVFCVWCFERGDSCSIFRVSRFGFRVSGFGSLISVFGFLGSRFVFGFRVEGVEGFGFMV